MAGIYDKEGSRINDSVLGLVRDFFSRLFNRPDLILSSPDEPVPGCGGDPGLTRHSNHVQMSVPTLQDLISEAQKLLGDLEAYVPTTLPPKPPDTVLPPYGITMTLMSLFGLQWDGETFDPGDNGVGAWGSNTRVPTNVGCALPRTLLTLTLGGTDVAHVAGYTVEVYSQVTQKTLTACDIVDEGPAAWTHRLIDGTFGLHKALGHIDYGLAHYGSNYNKWPAGFYVAYWINDPNGKTIEIKGVDFTNGKIIGS